MEEKSQMLELVHWLPRFTRVDPKLPQTSKIKVTMRNLFIVSVLCVSLILLLTVHYVHSQSLQALRQKLNQKESAVRKICDNARIYYSDSEVVPPGGCIYYTGCRGTAQGKSDFTQLREFDCAGGFGQSSSCGCTANRISKRDPVMLFAPNVDPNSASISQFSCFTARLTEVFTENMNDDGELKWQYMGSEHGAVQFYPGSSWETTTNASGCSVPSTCAEYDPRLRPWYISASSGPKNVILILDTSGSMMQFNRMRLMRDAATTVIRGLTHLDYVNVIEFNSRVGVCSFAPDSLVQATAENKEKLIKCVNDLTPAGATNFEVGFNKAFDLLDNSYGDTIRCNNVILFMTDGVRTAGRPALEVIEARNTNDFDARIFSFSFGVEADPTEPKEVSCKNKGVWSSIADGGDLMGAMAGYFRYFATLGLSSRPVVWSEKYEDFSGLGNMTTAAIPCSSDTGVLLGVAGVDIIWSDLTQILPEAEVTNELADRSSQCALTDFTEDQLESIRISLGGTEARCAIQTRSISALTSPISIHLLFIALVTCFLLVTFHFDI